MHYFGIGLMNSNSKKNRSKLLGYLEDRRDIFSEGAKGGGSMNPDTAEFDWMMVGGRFDGRLIAVPPTAYNNWLAAAFDCPYLYWSIGHQALRWEGRWVDPMALLWSRNTVQVRNIPPGITCDLAITPGGEWCGSTEDGPITPEKWQELLIRYSDGYAVGLDLHSDWRSPECDCDVEARFDSP